MHRVSTERYERRRFGGGEVFCLVIVLMITLVGLIAFNGGANIRLHSPSHFALTAAKA